MFVLLAAVLGFFVSIAADAAYDLLKGERTKVVYGALLYGLLFSYFGTRMMTWLLERINTKETEKKILRNWILYEWKNSKLYLILIFFVLVLTLYLL